MNELLSFSEDGKTVVNVLRTDDFMEIPFGVEVIGESAFATCFGIREIEIPNSVKRIEDYAFQICGLCKVEIPNSVTEIGMCAFDGCSELKEIAIPRSVTFIGIDAFEDCGSLERFVVDRRSETFDSSQGILYSADLKCLVKYPPAKDDYEYESEFCIEELASDAFGYISSLRILRLPSSLKKLHQNSINTDFLEKLYIPIDNPNELVIEGFKPNELKESDCELYVPIGAGYAYRHHPFFGKVFSKVIPTNM